MTFILFWRVTVWGYKYNIEIKHLLAIIGCVYPLAGFGDPIIWPMLSMWNASIFESLLFNLPSNTAGLVGIGCGYLKRLKLEQFSTLKHQALCKSLWGLMSFVASIKMTSA